MIPNEECVMTTDVPATGGTTTRTMASTTTNTELSTVIDETNEKLKYNSTESKNDTSKEYRNDVSKDSKSDISKDYSNDVTGDYESDGHAKANTLTDSTISDKVTSSTTGSTKTTAKPTECRICNGPPCLTPYVTTVRGETRDFYRILKDLNNNHLDSHSSDFLIRK